MHRSLLLVPVLLLPLLALWGLHLCAGEGALWNNSFAIVGIPRYAAGREIVPWEETRGLREMLAAGRVDDFNRMRASGPYRGKILELGSGQHRLVLGGLDLAGVDLSDCILAQTDFTASDLRGASFRGAYLVGVSFYIARILPFGSPVRPAMGRPTRLEGADFTGAAVATPFRVERNGRFLPAARFPDCDLSGAIGLPFLLHAPGEDLARVAAAGPGEMKSFFTGAFRARTDAGDVGTPCENPFQEIPAAEIPAWRSWGVDPERLAALRAVRITGKYTCADSRTFVNTDPDTVLVIGTPFQTFGKVYSLGPLVVEGEEDERSTTNMINSLFCDSVVWLRGRSHRSVAVFGRPVVGEHLRESQIQPRFCPLFERPGD